jgi:hypothetical protein
MNEQELQRILADPEFQQTVFNNLMKMFVLPHIELRQQIGELPTPFYLTKAQVLFYPDDRPLAVRVNDEVRAIADMQLKPGIEVKPGDPIYEHQFESVGNFRLTEDEDQDCGYIILVKMGDRWIGNFSFIYNRALSRMHFVASRQFWRTAQYALEQKYWHAFIDVLFSASELAVKAFMLGHEPTLRDSKKHGWVHTVFNQFARQGSYKTRTT